MAKEKTVELNEDRSQMMIMVTKASPEIEIKEAVGEYEQSI